MLKFNDKRIKVLVQELICLLFILVVFVYGGIYFPKVYEDVKIKVSIYILGVIFVYEFYMLLFRWKIITLSSECIQEEYYSILQKKPYRIKRITSWEKVKCVYLIKQSKMWQPLPCMVMVEFLNDRGQRDSYSIDTAGLYYYNYKGQQYDSRVVDYLNKINTMHSFKILFE